MFDPRLSPAVQDLGLGDDLLRQMQEQQERQRKEREKPKVSYGPATDLLLGVNNG